MPTTHEELNRYRGDIVSNLQMALNAAINMQQLVHDTEGESDLYRKLAFYLTPSLQHWLTGAQAGNMKDLAETFWRREQPQVVKEQQPGLVGDGHEVVTSKKKKKKK